MKNHSASLLVAFAELVGISAASSAWGAAPGYCALYAREYARAAVGVPFAKGTVQDGLSRLENRAYYRCLNLDEEPELPSASIYSRTDPDKGTGGTVAALDARALLVPADDAAKPSASLKLPTVAKPIAKRKPVHHRRRQSTAALDTQPPTRTNLDNQEWPRFSVVRLLNRVGALLQGDDSSGPQRSAVATAKPTGLAGPIPPMAILSNGDKSKYSACRNSPYMIARCSPD